MSHDFLQCQPANDLCEVIANLETRLNAIKTLESRIRLIKSYLESLPPSFQSAASSADTANSKVSYPILRNIASLLSGLSLLNPQDPESFARESLAQENDVALVSLLGKLGESIQSMRELGKKSAVIESIRQSSSLHAGLRGRERMVKEE